MTSQKDAHLENIRSIRDELLALVDGMDYCLDWKPDPESWSVREIIYHLVDTPEAGIHNVIKGILSEELAEFNLEPDLNNMNPQRLARDIDQIRKDIGEILEGLEQIVSDANDQDFAGKSTLAHLIALGRDEERTAQSLLEGLFARHWRGHLDQIRTLRETLGV